MIKSSGRGRSAPRRNRGPAAAADNERALIAAARKTFAAEGLQAPMSAIARRAGVGQGSLYRHFPDKISLALAAFEENVSGIEALAADAESTLPQVLGLITHYIVQSTVLIDLVRMDKAGEQAVGLADRVSDAMATHLAEAIEADQVPDGTTTEDLMLAIGMVAGAVSVRPPAESLEVAHRAWQMLGITVDRATSLPSA